MKKILFLTTSKVLPSNNGAALYTLSILKSFHKIGFNVTLMNFYADNCYSDTEIETLNQFCESIVEIKLVKKSVFRNISLFTPYTVMKYYTDSFIKKLVVLKKDFKFDLIVYDHLHMSIYRSFFPDNKSVLIEHNIEFNIWSNFSKVSRGLIKILSWIQWIIVSKYEIKSIQSMDGVISISNNDMETILKISSKPKLFLHYPQIEFSLVKTLDSVMKNNRTIVFIGSYKWFPNQKAAEYLINTVMPILRSLVDGVMLLLVGSSPTNEMIKAGEKFSDILVTGMVPSVDKYINDADIFVNCVEDGSGINIKVIEALAKGIPLISSKFGARGFDLIHGKHAYIYNDKIELISFIVELFNSQEKRVSLSVKGREFYETYKICLPDFIEFCNTL